MVTLKPSSLIFSTSLEKNEFRFAVAMFFFRLGLGGWSIYAFEMKFREIQPRGCVTEMHSFEFSIGNCDALRVGRHFCVKLRSQPLRLLAQNRGQRSNAATAGRSCPRKPQPPKTT